MNEVKNINNGLVKDKKEILRAVENIHQDLCEEELKVVVKNTDLEDILANPSRAHPGQTVVDFDFATIKYLK